MTTPKKSSKLEARIGAPLKKKYAGHARKTHGLDLSNWLRMIAHQDYERYQ